jgi:hypothetical protein
MEVELGAVELLNVSTKELYPSLILKPGWGPGMGLYTANRGRDPQNGRGSFKQAQREDGVLLQGQ